MFRVKQLFIYPIKGLSGISVQSAKALKEGFENDRRWMLIDGNNTFVSQRTQKALVDFEVRTLKDAIEIKHQQSEVVFNISDRMTKKTEATIWEHEVIVNEVSPEVSKWFSTILNANIRLVVLDTSTKRIKKYSNRTGSTEVSFADGYPYLIIGTASLNKLNAHLESPVNVSRFRGNIIIETNVAHEEDDWQKLQVGHTQLEVIKPCARCQVINIDQENGEVFKEPLKTLSLYRKENNKIYFGANSACLSEGIISVGDTLSI